MRKLLGAGCILLGAVLAQVISLRDRRRRRAALEDLCRALYRLAEEVRLARTPLPPLLKRLSSDCGGDAGRYLRAVSAYLRRGLPLEPAWREPASRLPLSPEDRRILMELGPEFRGDAERVRRAALSAAERLSQSRMELDALWRTDTRRTAALSLSAAAFLVILLY